MRQLASNNASNIIIIFIETTIFLKVVNEILHNLLTKKLRL